MIIIHEYTLAYYVRGHPSVKYLPWFTFFSSTHWRDLYGWKVSIQSENGIWSLTTVDSTNFKSDLLCQFLFQNPTFASFDIILFIKFMKVVLFTLIWLKILFATFFKQSTNLILYTSIICATFGFWFRFLALIVRQKSAILFKTMKSFIKNIGHLIFWLLFELWGRAHRVLLVNIFNLFRNKNVSFNFPWSAWNYSEILIDV